MGEEEIPFEAGLSIGNEKDPLARLNYEKQRLIDPKTGEIPDDILAREQAYAQTLPVAISSNKVDAWTQRGPYNIGGRTRALAIDMNDPDIMLAGGVSGGVYRTEDAGKSWEKVTGSSQLHSVTCIIQDTREGKTNDWYYCSGEVYGNSADYPGDGIFKSTDGGKTWKGLQIEGKPQEFRHLNYGWRLALDHTRSDSTILYLASYGAILRSADGGVNWNTAIGGLDNSLYLAGTDIAISPSGVYYITLNSGAPGNRKGVWRSEDGLHWNNITPSIFPTQYGRIVLDIHDADETLVYFLMHSPRHGKYAENHAGTGERNSLWKYRYKSGDGSGEGAHWVDLSNNIPALRQDDGYIWGDFMAQGGYNLTIRIKPDDSNFVAIGGTNIFVSSDGFKTDKNTNWAGGFRDTKDKIDGFVNGLVYANHHPDNHDIIFHPDDPKKMLTANDGGVAITNNVTASKVEWTSLNNGYFTTQFYTVSFNKSPSEDHAMSNIVLGGFQDNETQYIDLDGKTEDAWSRIACCDGAYSGLFDDGDFTWILTSKQLGGFFLYKFNKKGERLEVGRVDPTGGANYQFINQYVHDPKDPKRVYLPAGSFLWLNTNITEIPLVAEDKTVTKNWVRLRHADWVGKNLMSIDASTNKVGIVYMGTNDGNMYRVDNAHDEDNYTVTKLTETNDPLDGAGSISSVSVDPRDANQVLITFSNYGRKSIYFTTDGGETWRDVSGNLEENSDGTGAGTAVNVVKIVHSANGPIYMAGTNSGLYTTTGLPGESTIWNREGANNVGVCAIRAIEYRESDKLLFIGTHGCGSFSTTLDQVASTEELEKTISINLYPNPVLAELRLGVGDDIQVRAARIYDMNGRLQLAVNVLNSKTINVAQLPAGQYILQLETNKGFASRKFLKE